MEEIYRKPSFVMANKDMEQGGCGEWMRDII
jgi:hypothetical protein